MELKEVVNLRKLSEFVDESLEEERCEDCPFRELCLSFKVDSNCLTNKILGTNSDNEDLYDMEANGTLTEDYQIPVKE